MSAIAAPLDCGHPESPHSEITRGYGTGADGKRYWYQFCADRDRQAMLDDGRIMLYLTHDKVSGWIVTNWPGSLRFPAGGVKRATHGGGFGSQRTDAWFVGPDGYVWHAVNRGNMQIARCRRTRKQFIKQGCRA